jgi:hypothetical protein
MPFPPDLWTRPQPGGLAGLLTGTAAGGILWFYFFYAKFKTSKRKWLFVLQLMAMAGFCVGAVAGTLIGFELPVLIQQIKPLFTSN